MPDDALHAFERPGLERLKLAADVILTETDAIPAPLETELTLFRERIERALLLPARSERDERGEHGEPKPEAASGGQGRDSHGRAS